MLASYTQPHHFVLTGEFWHESDSFLFLEYPRLIFL